MKNQAIPERSKISHFKAYWLIDGRVKFAPVKVLGYTFNNTRVKLLFDKGQIFGLQFIQADQLNDIQLFQHLDKDWRFVLLPQFTPYEEILEKLL